MTESITTMLLIAVIALPTVATLALAISSWFRMMPGEAQINAIVSIAFGGATVCCAALLWILASSHTPLVSIQLGSFFEVSGYAFHWRLTGDHLSLPFAGFSSLLLGVIGAFSRRYLHREPGYLRFYMLLSLFGAGVALMVLGGSMELIFFGWEIIGLTSALLIAFFHDRRLPVAHGFRAFVTYRMCDIGLLSACVWLHHTTGGSSMELSGGAAPWATLDVPRTAVGATVVGLLMLLGAMGKGAQIPFGGWLPKAMEGPTPSSAIFYGAISVSLGPYLLLRSAHILEASPIATIAVIVLGAATAAHGTFVGRAQSDIKSALAYASMTQIGLIFVEIGLGFRYLALAHIVGHAALRSLQILRSPSLLHDYQQLERAMGGEVPRPGGHLERYVPKRLQPWLYRHALERGYFDAILRDYVVAPFLHTIGRIEALDAAWVRLISGEVTSVSTDDTTIALEKTR